MLKKPLIRLFFLFLALVFISPASVYAVKVDDYETLRKHLPGLGSKKSDPIPVIKRAEDYVIQRQAQKRGRDVRFKKPLEVYVMNRKYISVSFDVGIKTKGNSKSPERPAVFALLFERSADEKLSFSKGYYLSWVGEKDIKDYKMITVEQICKYFREIGAQECFPTFALGAEESKKTLKADLNHTHSASDIKKGTIKAKYLDASVVTERELDSALKGKADISMVTALSKSMKQSITASIIKKQNRRIAELEHTVQRLESLLAGISRNGDKIVFSGMNIQILSGTGTTDGPVNGLGNIIVGYNGGDQTSGSHNIIVGKGNSFSSYGGIVAGENNSISSEYCVVNGGQNNIASGAYAAVTGGKNNKATGRFSNVNGGKDRSISGVNQHFTN